MILEGKPITEVQLNDFITEYTKIFSDKDITGPQLIGINNAIKMGIFNLYYAAENAANKLNLSVIKIFNNQGQLIKTTVYD